MKTYIINIRPREDRRLLMDLQLRKNGWEIPEEGKKNAAGFQAPRLRNVEWTTGWEFNKVGSDITDDWLEENGFGLFDWKMERQVADMLDADKAPWWARDLTRGEIGCTLSHWQIWYENKDSTDPIMILEDDALFGPDLELKRDLAIDTLESMNKNWDVLYLGRVPLDKSREERLTKHIVVPKFSYCTYAYCVSPKGIKRLLDYNIQKGIIPADEFLSSTYVSHPRPDVSLKYPPSLIVYALDPVIVKQRTKEEVGSDTGLPEERK